MQVGRTDVGPTLLEPGWLALECWQGLGAETQVGLYHEADLL